MKTRVTLGLLLVAAVAGAVWFSASVSATDKAPAAARNNVVINADGIVIPGTQISKTDRDAMNRILNKYDKSLYRIETYKNGKLKKTQGKLTDVVTDKQLASEIAANVARTGFTQYAVEIRAGSATNVQSAHIPSPSPGSGTNVQSAHIPSPSPGSATNVQLSPSPGAATHPRKTKSDESGERLKAILKKYQKK